MGTSNNADFDRGWLPGRIDSLGPISRSSVVGGMKVFLAIHLNAIIISEVLKEEMRRGANAAGLEAGAVASPPGSKSFAPLDAIVLSHSGPRGQARWSQGWKGAGSIGPGCGTRAMARAAGAQPLTAVRGHWRADRAIRRSSEGVCYGHWPEWGLGASSVDWVRGRILPACEQTSAMDLKQAGFDRVGTTKSPQQAC
jgi:hypothetical protein